MYDVTEIVMGIVALAGSFVILAVVSRVIDGAKAWTKAYKTHDLAVSMATFGMPGEVDLQAVMLRAEREITLLLSTADDTIVRTYRGPLETLQDLDVEGYYGTR